MFSRRYLFRDYVTFDCTQVVVIALHRLWSHLGGSFVVDDWIYIQHVDKLWMNTFTLEYMWFFPSLCPHCQHCGSAEWPKNRTATEGTYWFTWDMGNWFKQNRKEPTETEYSSETNALEIIVWMWGVSEESKVKTEVRVICGYKCELTK